MGQFKHGGQKAKVGVDAPSAKAFAWLYQMLTAGKDLTGKVEVRHEGKCGACGRKLTTPESLDTGIGPDCAERLGINWARNGAGMSFDTLRFIEAGKAIFTVTSVATGVSFTYKVAQPKDKPDAPHFVSVLNGPDNWTNYQYFGYIRGIKPPVKPVEAAPELPLGTCPDGCCGGEGD